MPVWVSPSGDLRAVGAYGNAKAVEAGLHFRPLAETARDTLAWFGTLPPERQARLRAGISMEREGEILAAWRSR
jgi:2'-hydroxyisoflavone reductase